MLSTVDIFYFNLTFHDKVLRILAVIHPWTIALSIHHSIFTINTTFSCSHPSSWWDFSTLFTSYLLPLSKTSECLGERQNEWTNKWSPREIWALHSSDIWTCWSIFPYCFYENILIHYAFSVIKMLLNLRTPNIAPHKYL